MGVCIQPSGLQILATSDAFMGLGFGVSGNMKQQTPGLRRLKVRYSGRQVLGQGPSRPSESMSRAKNKSYLMAPCFLEWGLGKDGLPLKPLNPTLIPERSTSGKALRSGARTYGLLPSHQLWKSQEGQPFAGHQLHTSIAHLTSNDTTPECRNLCAGSCSVVLQHLMRNICLPS